MMDQVSAILQRNNILSHHNQDILIAKVKDSENGLILAKEILTELSDPNTIVYLSGGRTPKELYEALAKEENLEVGAVGLVDERYGPKWHANSNEKMIRDTGLLRYLQMKDIKFYPILGRHSGEHSESRIEEGSWTSQDDDERRQTAGEYDDTIRSLQNTYQKHIGILGIGLDGHTAGIAGNRQDFTNPMFEKTRQHLLISEFDDQKGMYKERVSMTFLGLSMLDFMIVLVFGDDKKEALEKMFADGTEEEIPSRFFKRPEIAKKITLVTDQQI